MNDEGTISLDDGKPRAVRDPGPTLVLVMTATDPLRPPVCVALAELDEIRIGRGPQHRVGPGEPRVLHIELADPATSARHARLTRAAHGWILADDGSKNGTLVNGRPVTRAELAPDDVIELGSSFFLFQRHGVAAALDPPAPRTLNAPLALDLQLLARVARARLPVLVLGETGTGKEVLARATHELSGRRGPFVAVNCGAIPTSLLESELFGVRKGAFTGATDRDGTVVAAHGGTLFLDEIAELPEPSQTALLRVLQEGEVVALGGTKPVRVDVRLVSATHQDLAARVAAGRFRNDLYARVRGHVLTLPPLRARREDLGLLCAALLRRVAGARAAELTFARAAARALMTYAWPHNIRELEQVLARAVALCEGTELQLAHLPDELVRSAGHLASPGHLAEPVAAPAAPPPVDHASVELTDEERAEREAIVQALDDCAGNQTRVAKRLGISRSTLLIKLRVYRIPRPRT